MTSELRHSTDVAYECWRTGDTDISLAAAIIEQDREAVRAEVVGEIVAWLRDDDMAWALIVNSDHYAVASEIEERFGGRDAD